MIASRDLACIVLSLRDQPELVEAVRSLAEQSEPADILVVNSGGGDPARRLAAAGLPGRVVNVTSPLLPGAARNVGIRATRSRYVAFLAADCVAGPGWTAARLREHRAGADAVAGVLTNAFPGNRSACAAFLLLHYRMSRHAPPHDRLLYGLSYDRRLFDRFGIFREDLRGGEDTEFNARIIRGARVAWTADICTAHRNPRAPAALLRDQYARGRRRAAAEARLGGRSRRGRIAVGALLNVAASVPRLWRIGDRAERRALIRAWPLVPAGGIAYAIGAMRGGSRAPGGSTLCRDVGPAGRTR